MYEKDTNLLENQQIQLPWLTAMTSLLPMISSVSFVVFLTSQPMSKGACNVTSVGQQADSGKEGIHVQKKEISGPHLGNSPYAEVDYVFIISHSPISYLKHVRIYFHAHTQKKGCFKENHKSICLHEITSFRNIL